MTLPAQQIHAHTFFPYNTQMRSRRLDYICGKHMRTSGGWVLSLRDLARSDHEREDQHQHP